MNSKVSRTKHRAEVMSRSLNNTVKVKFIDGPGPRNEPPGQCSKSYPLSCCAKVQVENDSDTGELLTESYTKDDCPLELSQLEIQATVTPTTDLESELLVSNHSSNSIHDNSHLHNSNDQITGIVEHATFSQTFSPSIPESISTIVISRKNRKKRRRKILPEESKKRKLN